MSAPHPTSMQAKGLPPYFYPNAVEAWTWYFRVEANHMAMGTMEFVRFATKNHRMYKQLLLAPPVCKGD